MMAGIKDYFVSRYPNGSLIECDYAQLEIRVLALATGDPTLISDINSGMDLHRYFASQIFGKAEIYITPEERKLAKGFSFQLQYGAGAESIANFWNVDRLLVERFIRAYYRRYSRVKDWQEANVASVKGSALHSGKKVVTSQNNQIPIRSAWLGSIWPKAQFGAFTLDEVLYDNSDTPVFPRTKIKNYPIQGGAADIVLLKLNEIRKDILLWPCWDNKLKLVNTVHDSFLFDVPAELVERESFPTDIKFLRAALEDVEGTLYTVFPNITCPIAFPVDIKMGPTWGEMKELPSNE